MSYSNFMTAYQAEKLDTIQRLSTDIPENFYEWKHIVDTTPIIVLYVWSDNCRPCHLVRDKFEALAHEFQNEDILFFKDNIDLPTSLHKTQVEVVPTFFIICDGNEMSHPTFKSRYTGWTDEMRDAIQFFYQTSRRAQSRNLQREQQEQQAQQPHIVCKNNVCYVQRD